MKQLFVLLIGLIILFNSQKICADEGSEITQDINLFILGKGGHRSPMIELNPPGNISTIVPNTTRDEHHIIPVENNSSDITYWISDPLYKDVFIEGDVHFTIWARCSSPRYLRFILYLDKTELGGGGPGEGVYTETKLVYNEPIEFNATNSKDILNNELKKFYIGERIGIGIEVEYPYSQPPADVIVLYNSTNYPSHMKISANTIDIKHIITNTLNNNVNVDIEIIDTFGIYDIKKYDIQVMNPSGEDININIYEIKRGEEGKLILTLMWGKSKGSDGKYTIVTSIFDNKNNIWKNEFILEVYFSENNNTASLFLLGPFFIIIIFIIIIAVFKWKKIKK